jgi:hypothetical protein
MRSRLLALFLAASAGAFGADRDFDRLVKAVEARFGVQQTHIPMMGAANFFVKVARPKGVAGFRLAVFAHLSFDAEGDGAALDGIMADASKGLHPLVRVRSRRDHEWTYIYTGEEGKITKVLVATFERHEATVVQVQLSMDALVRALGDPAEAGKIADIGR